MPLFTKAQLDAEVPIRKSLQESRSDLQEAARRKRESNEHFDVFLSHRFLDAQYIEKLTEAIENAGFSVFVDWRQNPLLDRSQVTSETADYLREMIGRCDGLLYAISENASDSKWMPWELGFSDGKHGKAAILPVLEEKVTEVFRGQEYLGLYPWISRRPKTNSLPRLFIHQSQSTFVELGRWLKGEEPTFHFPRRTNQGSPLLVARAKAIKNLRQGKQAQQENRDP